MYAKNIYALSLLSRTTVKQSQPVYALSQGWNYFRRKVASVDVLYILLRFLPVFCDNKAQSNTMSRGTEGKAGKMCSIAEVTGTFIYSPRSYYFIYKITSHAKNQLVEYQGEEVLLTKQGYRQWNTTVGLGTHIKVQCFSLWSWMSCHLVSLAF